MTEKLVRWLVFSVAIALLPLAFNGLKVLGRGETLTFVSLCSRGELLLISAAISAAAIGELVGRGGGKAIPKLLAVGSCVIILALASWWFADVSFAINYGEAFDRERVAFGSLRPFRENNCSFPSTPLTGSEGAV